MARQYAPLHTEIWNDNEFVRLPSQAQRLYLLAISQPNISWCGVVPYTSRRWANLAGDTAPRTITKAAGDLAKSGLVLLDEDSEELWVRSFIKYNSLQQPKLRNAAIREFLQVHSPVIRAAALRSYPWLLNGGRGDGHTGGHADAHEGGHSQESSELRVGVDVQGSVSSKTPSTENTNTNTEPAPEFVAEAERQADAFLAKDARSIVDRKGWVAKRARNLAAEAAEAGPAKPPRILRVVCINADCRDGFDLSGEHPVPCTDCKRAEAS
jgi:hypothetical protein